MAPTVPIASVTVAILAGGQGTRLGGLDKGLVAWNGRALVEHALAQVPPGACVLISANRNLERYAAYGHPVVVDDVPAFPGPLAGIAKCLAAAPTRWVLTVPVDVPVWPPQLVQRLCVESDAAVVAAHDGERRHPLFARWSASLAGAALDTLLAGDGAVWSFQDRCGAVEVRVGTPASYTNLNEPW